MKCFFIETNLGKLKMSNRAIIIMVLVLLSATGYLLFKSDGNVDMGGEKHGAEAIGHGQETKPATADAAKSDVATPATPASSTDKK